MNNSLTFKSIPTYDKANIINEILMPLLNGNKINWKSVLDDLTKNGTVIIGIQYN